ncbi:PIG-L family deacetylase [Methylobacillus glycogenes]|uniref:PIG-L family deacetylase n=1 Tax=Methylobacillus glycogenes TaxID=406 RepID=UPI000470D23C|nr:PIG-L family deacetylase [Methylobacillus glycogenes]
MRLKLWQTLALTWLLCLVSAGAQAQTQVEAKPLDSGGIAQGLDKLAVLGSVLYIAAHPDDENTQLLAWLAQQKHYRTAYLSLTRGDGGQNLLGDEQGIPLGLIRSQELLAARREDGAEQYFTRARDFGFSKRADETLEIWQQERILGDIVWLIRKLQPDVIITRFPEDARAGHGQHQASAILARLAFAAAADPQRFPEQLQEVAPWQAKRLVWNTWESFLGSGSTRSPEQLRIDVGGYNPRLGKSYGEIAALSRNHHQSQGFGSRALRGHVWETFAWQAGQPLQNTLLEGIDTSWGRVAQAQALARQITQLRQGYDPDQPANSIPALLAVRKSIAALPEGYWRTQKLQETEQLILAAAGVWIGSFAERAHYALGEEIAVKTSLVVRGPVPVALLAINQIAQHTLLQQDEVVQVNTQLQPKRISQPYWLRARPDEGAFALAAQNQLAQAWADDAPEQSITLAVAGQTLTLTQPVLYQRLDPLRGEVSRAVQVTPPVSIKLENQAYLIPLASRHNIQLSLQSLREPGLNQAGLSQKDTSQNITGTLKVQAPPGWQVRPQQQAFKLGSGQRSQVTLEVQAPSSASAGDLKLEVEIDGKQFALEQKTIAYAHIAELDWFAPAEARLVSLDIKTGGRNIGYIPGAGDKVAAALKQLGYTVTELDSRTLAQENLQRFDAIITGVRAYNVDANLAAAHAPLMEYVSQGGVLLAQYNNLSPAPASAIGPYPFQLSRARVNEENAAVRLLQPEHRLLNTPNRIGTDDFAGWVQERGLYFVSQADPRYEHLLGMHDQGEAELDGGLITTTLGKGRFIYAPLAFFRQLPAGVPGAARLLANLLARDDVIKGND